MKRLSFSHTFLGLPGIRVTSASQAAVGGSRHGRPSPGEVAQRAYALYVGQGMLHGQDVRHWLEAEAQLHGERRRTRRKLRGPVGRPSSSASTGRDTTT